MTAPQPPERCAGCGAERNSAFTNYERRGARQYAHFACGSGWNSDGWHTACLDAFHLVAVHRAREQALVAAARRVLKAAAVSNCDSMAEDHMRDVLEELGFARYETTPTSHGDAAEAQP